MLSSIEKLIEQCPNYQVADMVSEFSLDHNIGYLTARNFLQDRKREFGTADLPKDWKKLLHDYALNEKAEALLELYRNDFKKVFECLDVVDSNSDIDNNTLANLRNKLSEKFVKMYLINDMKEE